MEKTMGNVGQTAGLIQQLKKAKEMQNANRVSGVRKTPLDVLNSMNRSPDSIGFGGVGKAVSEMAKRGKVGSGSIAMQGNPSNNNLMSKAQRLQNTLNSKNKPLMLSDKNMKKNIKKIDD